MSFDVTENNTQYLYTVVAGIDPGEKAEFLSRLEYSLSLEGWGKDGANVQ
jgi:hypothetical protein